MGSALQNTLVFGLLIALGVIMRLRISKKSEIKGVKALILDVALPATIFIALLKIEINRELLLLPFMALLMNALMILGAMISAKFMNIPRRSKKFRTIMMLFPSFAPGLSCFPFLIEYFGDEALALAAFADVGNKIFVLLILYLLAMRWYYQKLGKEDSGELGNKQKIKALILKLVSEPINIVLVLGVLFLSFGLTIDSFPMFVKGSLDRMSLMMTPLILIFIGLSISISRRSFSKIFQVLMWRTACAFLISTVLLIFMPAQVSVTILILIVVFPQSSCSFWPYAHMSSVESLERKKSNSSATFDTKLGLNLMAFSLPLSTTIIIAICSNATFFVKPTVTLGAASLFVFLALIPLLLSYAQKLFRYGPLTLENGLSQKVAKRYSA